MIIPQYVYDYVLFGGNIICHVLSVVDVIISDFFFFFFLLSCTLLRKQQVT